MGLELGVGLGVSGGSKRPDWTYLIRDVFTTDLAAGNVNGTDAEPGPGTRTVTDVESAIKILSSRLRGGPQATSAVWGESKVVYDGVARAEGRALVALVAPGDFYNDFAFGFASGTGIGDPSTDGHGLLFEFGDVKIATPGLQVVLNGSYRFYRPIQYLVTVALGAAGAVYLLSTIAQDTGGSGGMLDQLGVPAYPNARVLWWDPADTTATLYPQVTFYDDQVGYPDGHMIDDLRVVDVPEWSAGVAEAVADVADRFTRADSNTSLGGDWLDAGGTWGISSNQARPVSSPAGTYWAWLAGSEPDGLYQWDIVIPTDFDTQGQAFGGIFRVVDSINFLRWVNNGLDQFHLQVWKDGAYHDSLYAQAYTWTPGATYRVSILAAGNRYKIYINGVRLDSDTWKTDAGENHLNGAGIGLYTDDKGMGSTLRWDNVAMMPASVALPGVLRDGAKPQVLAGGTVLASDSFTDDNGTALDAHSAESGGQWTVQSGTWEIQSNRATWSIVSGSAKATQDLGVTDAECQVDITLPGAFTNDKLRAGIVGRFEDSVNHIEVRLYMDPTQVDNDELELLETIAGTGAIVHKVNIGPFYETGATHTMKVQFIGDVVHVFLDGVPRISYYVQAGSPTGTNFGLVNEDVDDGCVFDNWEVRAL